MVRRTGERRVNERKSGFSPCLIGLNLPVSEFVLPGRFSRQPSLVAVPQQESQMRQHTD
ncbi:hypothetical protein Lokhon_00118 (plasmid) [Limimaricola hongkongensis DSM 17492]|uniref:Uncharacterized protein n=1 Tax=Limimaricola hongkongensis DSM 17492 TaxID=1122180 RepID=A0A017H990_9RHOB|nr:hypothetical protein Lokhon_00118 [Limimaricola hongkongensis DSM 17492]